MNKKKNHFSWFPIFSQDFCTENILLANTYVLGIIDGTYVGMCEDTGTI